VRQGITPRRAVLACRIVLGVVQGESLSALAQAGMGCSSRVYELMHRFIDQGLLGLLTAARTTATPK